MKIIAALIYTVIAVIAYSIFITAFKEVWNEIGRYVWKDIKEWSHSTRLGAYIHNRKNGVKVLSEKEFNRLSINYPNRTIIYM